MQVQAPSARAPHVPHMLHSQTKYTAAPGLRRRRHSRYSPGAQRRARAYFTVPVAPSLRHRPPPRYRAATEDTPVIQSNMSFISPSLTYSLLSVLEPGRPTSFCADHIVIMKAVLSVLVVLGFLSLVAQPVVLAQDAGKHVVQEDGLHQDSHEDRESVDGKLDSGSDENSQSHEDADSVDVKQELGNDEDSKSHGDEDSVDVKPESGSDEESHSHKNGDDVPKIYASMVKCECSTHRLEKTGKPCSCEKFIWDRVKSAWAAEQDLSDGPASLSRKAKLPPPEGKGHGRGKPRGRRLGFGIGFGSGYWGGGYYPSYGYGYGYPGYSWGYPGYGYGGYGYP
ncbi:hypothetical protein CSUI_006730, partial [Cystoisospora suis]